MMNEKMRQAVEQVEENFFLIYPSCDYPTNEARHNFLSNRNGEQPRIEKDMPWEFTARVSRKNPVSGETELFEEAGVVFSWASSNCDCVDDAVVKIKDFYKKNSLGTVFVTTCWLIRINSLIAAQDVDLNKILWDYALDTHKGPVVIAKSERLL